MADFQAVNFESLMGDNVDAALRQDQSRSSPGGRPVTTKASAKATGLPSALGLTDVFMNVGLTKSVASAQQDAIANLNPLLANSVARAATSSNKDVKSLYGDVWAKHVPPDVMKSLEDMSDEQFKKVFDVDKPLPNTGTNSGTDGSTSESSTSASSGSTAPASTSSGGSGSGSGATGSMIYPGAVWRPGANANYKAGKNNMTAVVCHYTAGKNSLPIMDNGYFHFLIARDGTIYQGAEADAVCWHAGSPWNGKGPGIEVEYFDESDIFTPAAASAAGGLVDWLISLGIPNSFYDGDRVQDYNGFITHRSLIQTGDYHYDYWPYLPHTPNAPIVF